jgi:deoxyribodipyrimidine photo-lyase
MSISIFWHRRDLRFEDNAGLYHALKSGKKVLPLFIFDTNILDKLEDRDDPRVSFIHDNILSMQTQLIEMGTSLIVRYGDPLKVWESLLEEFDINAVYTNRDYEPYALQRDQQITQLLTSSGISFYDFKDHVIFDKDEVVKGDGTPYTVFTPYSKKWKAKLSSQVDKLSDVRNQKLDHSFYLQSYPTTDHFSNFEKVKAFAIPSLEEMGFIPSSLEFSKKEVTQGLIKNYKETRNFPAIPGTSRLGIHFRFGTISIREKARKAQGLSETYLNELIWRDFYSSILSHFPHVVDGPFRKKYEFIEWRNNENEFELWCQGKTGYPIVDAGMRELNETGYMHNRVRMIVASFLTKHLLIDWRWGEAYFARKLLDFDLASNNGGWQWAAGCGTDAAPYFRIFNPISQQEKFDKEFKYVKKWVAEYGTTAYPEPIVDHKMARERCLQVYKAGLALSEIELD